MAKTILQCSIARVLSLDNWLAFLHILPLEIPQLEQIFCRMLCSCKITKFWDVNFKILLCILATPKIISKICGEDNIHYCAWCGCDATLEHILLQYPNSRCLHASVYSKIKASSFSDETWIFGHMNAKFNPIIWITNFCIYKCHLVACQGSKLEI